jgi:nucleotide-binding universal stress UspA family protein
MEQLTARSVADGLCEAASDSGLVVMATSGRGPLWRFLFGSTSHDVMRKISIPLLLVRGATAPADLGTVPSLRRFLIPLDGSAAAERILPVAHAFAALTRAEQTLLQVIRPVPEFTLMAQRERDRAMGYLRHTMRRIDSGGNRNHSVVTVAEYSVAKGILHQARVGGADLIALSPSRRRGLARMFRRSVVHQVLQKSPFPVLIN